MSAQVRLVFLGKALPGFQLEDVKRDLGRLLNANDAKLKALFAKGNVVIKRELPAADAPRYLARLRALGADVVAEPILQRATSAPEASAAASTQWPTLVPPEDAAPARPAAPAQTSSAPVHAPPAPSTTPRHPAPPAASAPEPAKPKTAPPPLALQPAEEEIVCPNCAERQSKRILCRACATNMPMGIAAKLEEEAQRRAERAAALERRRAQRSGRPLDEGEKSASLIGFSFSGRVARLPAMTAGGWLLIAMLLLTVHFLRSPSLPRALLCGVGLLAVSFFSMRLTVLRCHDSDRHGWWALLVFVPYVGGLISLLIALLPGNPEVNEYGPPPPKGKWRWLGLALVVFGLSIVLLARASIGFMERLANEMEEADDSEDVVELSTDTGAVSIQEAFGQYAAARGHKAFAVSSEQAFGWVGHAASQHDAVRGALAQCDSRRKPYTAPCQVVNVNGQGGH